MLYRKRLKTKDDRLRALFLSHFGSVAVDVGFERGRDPCRRHDLDLDIDPGLDLVLGSDLNPGPRLDLGLVLDVVLLDFVHSLQ